MSGPGKPIIKAEYNLLIKAKKPWVEFTYTIPTGHFPSESFIGLCKCHFDIIFTESIKHRHYTPSCPCREDAPATEIKICAVVCCCRCSSSDSQSTVSFWKERKNEKNRGEKKRELERERQKTWAKDCGRLYKLAQSYQQHFMVFWNSFKGNLPLCALA